MNKDKKTIQYLNSRAWYRFIKVIFVLFYSIAVLIAVGVSYGENYPHYYTYGKRYIGSWDDVFLYGFLSTLGVVLFFEFTRRAFYYVVLGSVRPQKNIAKQILAQSQPQNQNIYCTKCGVSNNINSTFCRECGEKHK